MKTESHSKPPQLEYNSEIFMWKRREMIRLLLELEKEDLTQLQIFEKYLSQKIIFDIQV